MSSEKTPEIGSTQESIDIQKLIGIWSTPTNHPLSKYQQIELLSRIHEFPTPISPRLLKEDIRCRNLVHNSGEYLDGHTAVILDSGGSHSVAMATVLATSFGLQPIIKIPHKDPKKTGPQTTEQIGVMIKTSHEMQIARAKIKSKAPPVFVLDTHRNDGQRSRDPESNFKKEDFPTAEELRNIGVTRIIYLDESNKNGDVNTNGKKYPPDLIPTLTSWESDGITLLNSGISPIEPTESRHEELRHEELLPLILKNEDAMKIRAMLGDFFKTTGVNNPFTEDCVTKSGDKD